MNTDKDICVSVHQSGESDYGTATEKLKTSVAYNYKGLFLVHAILQQHVNWGLSLQYLSSWNSHYMKLCQQM